MPPPRATPYTPVFPPSLHVSRSPVSVSTSCDSSTTVNEHYGKKPYIDLLKERHILLASMPQGELCPPSRQSSPESENRINALRLRMHNAREMGFPHDPMLILTCSGLRGGDWVGDSECNADNGECQRVLPDTEEEWFQWERKQKAAREHRAAERKAAEDRDKIAKWSEEIEGTRLGRLDMDEGVLSPRARRQCGDGSSVLGFPVIKSNTSHTNDKATTSRYFLHRHPPPLSLHTDNSDPVERMSSPMPLAPALDPLPDFSDSFSMPDSPPSLPQLPPSITFPDDLPPAPSFAPTSMQTSTPNKRDAPPFSVFQLSSPVSPPRIIRPLTVSRTPSSLPTKRRHECVEMSQDVQADITEEPSTPRAIKKTRIMAEPITPASVPRQNCSQEQRKSPNLQRLPTLTALLASSRKTPRGRSKLKETPSHDAVAVPEFSPSQPTYSMFRPQFQSTQPRARSLPPSPGQLISPQKSPAEPASSSGMGFYQSQFNVESKVDEVAAFLSVDVWNVES